jgi:hypothetical protein
MHFDDLLAPELDELYQKVRQREEKKRKALYLLSQGICPYCGNEEIEEHKTVVRSVLTSRGDQVAKIDYKCNKCFSSFSSE